jgi:hypothetical protein
MSFLQEITRNITTSSHIIERERNNVEKVKAELKNVQKKLEDAEYSLQSSIDEQKKSLETLKFFKDKNLKEIKSFILNRNTGSAVKITNGQMTGRISFAKTPLTHGQIALFVSQDVYYLGYIHQPNQNDFPIFIAYHSYGEDEETAFIEMQNGIFLMN